MDEPDPFDEDLSGAGSTTAAEREALTRRLMAAGQGWVEGTATSFQAVRWRPDLQRDDPPAVCHIHVADRLRPFLLERINAARSAGYEVHIASDIGTLWDDDVIEALAKNDVIVHDVRGEALEDGRHLVTLIADRSIKLTRALRTAIAGHLWETRRQGDTAHARGRRFEALVCLLLSQVEDFSVVERNLRTATEELDAVIQVSPASERCWVENGVPFILVEAKNWTDSVDTREVTILWGKLRARGGRARIGFLIASSGFTGDAEMQLLRIVMDGFTVVLCGPDEIGGWIDAQDVDQYVEAIVRRAMLR